MASALDWREDVQEMTQGVRSEALEEDLHSSPTSHDTLVSETNPADGTVLNYLAYGSNLSAETFLGKRGIRPLSQMNVCVPSLRLTFDLPGLPYLEPCFANTALRDPNEKPEEDAASYHKDRWHKPLVGVLYGLTPQDYAHVIATEGGGASYHDIVVQCYALPPHTATVPQYPSGPPIAAHTLFAPYTAPPRRGDPPADPDVRLGRPDPAYAQASARYLKLITDGAEEHDLPAEYREYLAGLRPYMIRTQRQRMGQFVFGSLWLPFIMLIFSLARMLADEKGRIPAWLARVQGGLFRGMWGSYDMFFRGVFGDGERSVERERIMVRERGAEGEKRREEV